MASAAAVTGKARQESALELFRSSGSLLCLDVPEGTELGIDFSTVVVGPSFKGVKFVPPGVHFLHYRALDSSSSSLGLPSGLLFRALPGSVLVLQWDKAREELLPAEDCPEVGQEQARRLAEGVKRLEFDRWLGPMPVNASLERLWKEHMSCLQNPSVLSLLLSPFRSERGVDLVASLLEKEAPSPSVKGVVDTASPGKAWTGSLDDVATLKSERERSIDAMARPLGSGLYFAGLHGEGHSIVPSQVVHWDAEGGSSSSSSSSEEAVARTRAIKEGLLHPRENVLAMDETRADARTCRLCSTQNAHFVPLGGSTSRFGSAKLVSETGADTSSSLELLLRALALQPLDSGCEPVPCDPTITSPLIPTKDQGVAALLAELQFCFLGFLLLQQMECFQRWKLLVDRVCRCDRLLSSKPHEALFVEAFSILSCQARQLPLEFFFLSSDETVAADDDDDDEEEDQPTGMMPCLSRMSFFQHALVSLARSLRSSGGIPPAVREQASLLLGSVKDRFGWSPPSRETAVTSKEEGVATAAATSSSSSTSAAAAAASVSGTGREADLAAVLEQLRLEGAWDDDDDPPTIVMT
jgi:hypothetical protein